MARGAAALALLLGAGCGNGSVAALDGPAGGDAGADGGPLVLQAGQVVELPSTQGAAGARLATPAGDERFVLVVASTDLTASGDAWAYDLTLGAAPAAAPAPLLASGCALDGTVWHTTPLPGETPPTGPAPRVGDTRTLQVSNGAGTEAITAQVAAVGQSAVVWLDTTVAHPATLDPAVIADFLGDFEKLILPRDRTVFGIESDLDGDGRIGLVFTPLTQKTAVAFFSACDLQKLPGCRPGNQGEFLYLTPPADIKPPYNTPAAIKEILAHELSHLIHFGRKVLRNKLTAWGDSAYLDEGIGALGQDTSGFQAGNLYVTQAGLDSIDDFSLGDTLADGAVYDTSRDGALRGGSYLFVRWLYDRGGGDTANLDGTITSGGGPALLRALLDSPLTVAGALGPIASVKLPEAAIDFYTALAASNRDEDGGVLPENACFRFLPAVPDAVTTRQRGASVFASFHGMRMNGPATQDATAPDRSLRAGGVEYLALDAAPGQPTLAFTVTTDVAAGPRFRLARVR